MKKVTLLLIGLLMVTASCQPPTPVQPTPTAIPPVSAPAITLPPADITITSVGNTCNLTGAKQVRAGTFTVNWLAEDKSYPAYAIAFVILLQGKTIDDLKAWPSTDQPPWTTLESENETPSGTRQHITVAASEGPLFVVCFTGPPPNDKKEMVLGPIEVIK